jgi:hypothetical protein
MNFKPGDKVIYIQDLRTYGLELLKYKGEITNYSSDTDKVYGEYEVRYFNYILSTWQRCAVKEEYLSLNIKETRKLKLEKLNKNA